MLTVDQSIAQYNIYRTHIQWLTPMQISKTINTQHVIEE